MSNIILKAHSANQTVAEVVLKPGTTTKIKAQKQVNYELLQEASGRAPDHIVTKRVGKDLHINLDGKEGDDLIIEGFYNSKDAALIGLAEDGQYYYYIPDTADFADYVTELAAGDVTGQALGGQPYSAPWWMGATTEGSILPWLAGIVTGFLVTADDKEKPVADTVNVNANPDGSVTVDLPKTAETGEKVTVEVTNPNGTTQTVELTKEQDGSWTSSNPSVVPSVPAGSNSTTIANDQVKDGSTVTATDKNGQADSVVAANPTPDAPKVSAPNDETGAVTVELPTNNVEPGDTVEISYTKPNGEQATATVTKQPDGSWTSSNPAITIGTNADGNPTATIPNTEVKDNTDVTATAKDGVTGQTSAPATNKSGNPTPDAPKVSAPNDETGVVTVELPTNNVEPGDKVEVSYTKPDGTPATTTLTKQPDGSWTSDNPAVIVGTDANGKPVATFPNKEVKDNTPVTAVSKDAATGEASAPSTNQSGDPVPTAPVIIADETNGGAWVVDFPEDAEVGDKVAIKFTDPSGKDVEVIFTKTGDEPAPSGTWTSNDPRLTFDPTTGTVKVPDELVKDGTSVSGTSYNRDDVNNEKGNDSKPATTADLPPGKPEVLPPNNETGDVVIKLPTENVEPGDTVTIEYTKPDGTKGEATLTKTEDGWQADPNNPDVTLDKDNDGKADTDANGNPIATIPGDKVKDNTPVTATANDKTTEKGDVVIKLPTENVETGDTVKVEYTKPDGTKGEATLTKTEDGWQADPNNPDVTLDKDGDGKADTDANGNPIATIPGDKVQDGTVATVTNPDGTTSTVNKPTPSTGTGTSGNPEPSAPEVTANPDGSVSIKLPEDAETGDAVKVIYTNKDGETVVTTVVKDKDGTWKDTDPNTTIDGNTLTIPNEAIKDGTEVTAVSVDASKANIPTDKDGNYVAPEVQKNPTEEELAAIKDQGKADTKPTADVLPSSPVVDIDEAVGVRIIDLPKDAENGDKVVVKYTDPNGNDKIAVVEKTPDGWKPVNDSPVVAELPTDVAEGTKATVTYKDPTGAEKEATLTFEDGEWKADPNNPDVEVGKDADGKPVAKLPIATIEAGSDVTVEVEGKEPVTITTPDSDLTVEKEVNGDEYALLPNDKVKDGTPVTAYSVNAADKIPEDGNLPTKVNPSNEGTAPNPTPTGTEVIAPTDGSGDVIIKLPTNNVEPGDTVKVEYTKPDGTKGEATLTKTEDGWQADPNNPDVTLDKDNDGKADTDANGNPIATIPGDKVKDNTPITVTSGNADGTGTPEVKEDTKSGDQDPEAPVVTAVEDKVTIKLPEEGVEIGDYVKVGYTDVEGNGKIAAITLTKDGWVSNDPNIVVGEDGKVATIDKSKLQPGSEVVAVTINASAQDDEGKTASDKVEDATKEEIEGLKDQGKADQDGVDNQDVAPAQPTVVADEAKGVTVTMPTENVEPGDKVTVGFTKPGETTTPTEVTYTAQPDGTWKAEPADAAKDAGLPETVAKGGEVTVPNDKVKDGSPVTAVATDAAHPNETGNTANAPDLAPAQPTVVADEAKGVTVTMPTENVEPGDKVTVSFTKPGETTPTDVVYTAQPDGTWKAEPADAAKDAGLPETVAKGGEVTVPNDKVKDGSPVTAVATDAAHPNETGNTANAPDLAPAQPTVVADEAKGVTVTMPTENVEPGDKVTVSFTKPGETTPTDVVYTAQPDGTWKVDPADAKDATDAGLPETVAKGGEVTVPNDKVKDGSPVTAVATDAAHPNETGNTANAPDLAPAQPTVVADEAKGVTVTMPTENVEPGDKVTVGFTKPGETTPTEVTYTAQPDGTWKVDPADAKDATDAGLPETVAEGGEVTVPNDKVKDGSPVTAVATDAAHPNETGNTANAPDLAPAQPTVVADEAKGVTVTMPTENVEPGDKVTVGFTKPGETTPTEVTYTAQPDGTWKVDPTDAADAKDAGLPETVAKGGEVTVPNDKVKDGSPVTAVATDEAHPTATGNTANAPDLAPAQPTVEANPTTGDVTVTMPTENVEPGDKVTVSFTKPGEDKPTDVVYTAQPDGTWKVDPTDAADAKDAGLPETVAEGGDITLPNDKVKDNSPVQAVATDEKNTNPTVDDKNSATTPQITPTGLGLEPNPNGDVVVNLPTENAEPGDKVDVKVVNPATGKEETVTLTKQPDGTWESSNPDVVPSTTAENPNSTTIPNDKVKDGSDVKAVAYDEGTQPDWTSNDVETVPAADPQPTGLEVSKPDENGNVIVTLPTENVEPGDKVEVVITAPDGTETPITFEKTPEGWTVDPADKGIIIDGNTATIPKDLIPNNSTVTADTINGTDGQVSEEKEVDNRVQTEKPTVQDIFAIDTSNPADEQAEAVKVTGKTADPFSDVEIVYKGEVIGTGKSDKDGNFEITATPKDGVVLTKDEPIEVYATDTVNDKLKSDKADGLDVLGEDGMPTGEKVPVVVPEVIDGPEGHIGDRIAPNQPTLAQGEDAGSVVLTFPTTDTEGQPVQNGDIVEVNFTDEQGNKHIVLFEKVDGGWQSNNPELVPGSGNGLVTTPSVTIPADTLLDASTVAAQTRDIAGNESEWEFENAGSDEDKGFSPDPTIESVVAYDTSSQADRNPEYVHIQGSAVYPASADPEFAGKPVSNGTVTISFPEFVKDGKPVSITVNTDANGKFQLIAKESDSTPLKAEHNGITALSLNDEFDIVAFTQFQMFSHDTARGHLPSYIDNGDGTSEGNLVTGEVLPVLDGADYHIGDKALPEQPTLTPADSGDITNPDGGMKVGLPQSANAGDKVIVEFKDENNQDQKVTLTKQDDGSWKSSNSLLIPDVAPRTDEATIPEDNLLDGSTVSAYSEDLAGNVDKNAAGDIIKQTASAGSDDYNPEKTATPTYSTVEAQDTAGDTKPEKVTIVGKTEPNAVVVVTKGGVEAGKTTADENGNFTLNIDNTNGTLATLDKLDMVATAPTKLPSDATEVSVPRVVPATAPLVTPNEGGSVVILPQGNDTKVTVKYFDEKNVEKTTVVTKDPVSGLWNISGDNTKQDESGATVHDEAVIDFDPKTGGVTIYEPSLQDVGPEGNATVVTAIGNNGNRAIYDRETKAVVKAVSALEFSDVYAKDTSVAANDEPEEVHFTIKTNAVTTAEQINTKVEIISPDGTVYNVQNVVEDKKLDGTVGITIRESGNEGLDLKVGSIVRVTQTTADRDETIKFFTVPALGEGEKYHTDVTPPEAPKVTTDGNGAGIIALPKVDTHNGDKVEVSIVPTGQKDPVTVTLTKTPDGWISDNPGLVPSTVGQEDKDTVVIPHRNIEDNSVLSAKSVGTEGKSSDPDLVQIDAFTADIDPATISGRIINEGTPNQAVEATINLNNLVDENPDVHNAKELIVELPLIKDNGEKVTATFKFDVLDGSTGDLKQFLLKDSGIVNNSGTPSPSSNLTINSSEADRLRLTDGSTAKLDPNGVINAITSNDEGTKEVAYDLGALGYTPYVEPKTQAPSLLGEPHEVDNLVKVGEVKVTPHADNDAMQITYPVEHGNGRTEIVLAQKGADGWTLIGNSVNAVNQNGEKLVTIDPQTGVVTLHPDAVADHQRVTAIGLKTGKQPSDPASVIAGQEPQSIGEFWGTINDLLPSSPTAGRQDGQDVGVWRNGLQGENNAQIGNGTYGKSTALVSLVDQLKAANDFASETVGTVGSRTSYTLNTNEQDNIVRIYNSLGNMNTNSMDHSGVVTVNTHDGNDAIVIGRDLGFSGTTPSGDRYMTVNTGEGHDVITVGATNDWFKVVQYFDRNPATGRYDIPGIVDVIPYDAQLPQNARYLPNLDLYNDVSKVRRTGGHLANANVNMGNGDDALVVSGVDSVSSAAISWSTINMGDGHNRVIVAPNGVDSNVEIRGAIAQGAVIRGGKDTDYVQAPLVYKDARIELGAGNDTVKLTKVADTAQVIMGAGNDVAELRDVVNSAVIDMGAGNDIVTMTGSFNNSAVVRLGDGDDRFNWGFKTSGGGVVDGGAGYDTISLQGYGSGDSSPVGWRASTPVSNIKTADFKNIEEIVMNGNNALDIRFADIRDTSTHTFTLDNGEAKRAKFIVSANKERDSVVDGRIGSNKVDFGQTDWNRDSDRDLSDTSAGSGGRWGDVGDVRLNGKTYDIFRHTSVGGSHEYDVLVEQGITII